MPSSKDHAKQCKAMSKQTGERCEHFESTKSPGSGLCHWHGGDTPSVIAAAQRRFLDAMDALTDGMISIALSAKRPSDRIAAFNSIADRSGLPKTTITELDVGSLTVDQVRELLLSNPDLVGEALEGIDGESEFS